MTLSPVEQVLFDEAAKAAADRGAMTIFILKIYSALYNISIEQAQQEFARYVVNSEDYERSRIESELQIRQLQ